MSEKLDALLQELALDQGLERHWDASFEFMKKHGYNITFMPSPGYFLDNDEDFMIPNAVFVCECNRSDPLLQHEDIPEVLCPYSQFIKDGGKFINDIYGVEPDTYIDTSKNRKIILDYMIQHPEKAHHYWYNDQQIYDDAAWDDYNDSFKNAKNCHFFGELQLSPSNTFLVESEDTVGEENTFVESLDFPNGVSFNIYACLFDDYHDGEVFRYEAALLDKNENEIVRTESEPDCFGKWELTDNNGNSYHVRVSPALLEKQNIKESYKRSEKKHSSPVR